MSDEKDARPEVVSFTTAEGTKITCSVEVARKLGYSAPKKSTASKPASSSSEDKK